MENRDKIISKLNALRAKANNAGTPEEAATFMAGFNKLMQKYKLTETDLEIKQSKVEGFAKSPPKALDKITLIVNKIAVLTETRAIVCDGKHVFLGLGVDLQYANWVYDLISDTMNNALHVLPTTPLYHRLINNGVKGKEVKENFKIGFLYSIALTLDKMIAENRKPGVALAVLKNAIIQQFIDDAEIDLQEGKGPNIKLYDGAFEAASNGMEEGAKVKLRQTVDTDIAGYLN